jgi:Amt family ammonium transporter
MVIFCIAALSTYSLGYAFAYGGTYIIGFSDYFTTFTYNGTDEGEQIQWVLLFAANNMTAQLAVSGINERAKLIVAMVYSILITLIIFPLAAGWTLGQGFLYKLGLVDFSGCVSIHLIAGFASFFGAVIIK